MIGLSQEEMAEKLGVHVNTYISWEEDPKKFKVDKAFAFLEEIKKFDATVKFEDIFLN